MVQGQIEIKEEGQKAFRDRVKSVMSGISGAFVFPIATLAILAFFLSIGGFLESLNTNLSKTIGGFLKQFSFPLLKALPILFCVAFAASFCKDDVVCVWGSLIAYLAFMGVQNAFIHEDETHYMILFPGAWRDGKNMVDKVLGLKTLNTSIFGSFLVGGVIMPYIQRKWANINLKGPIAFFSGKRFIPLVSAVLGGILAMNFLLLWPWIGKSLGIAGNSISKYGYGGDSFLFGLIEKSLIPFGLHHAFYAPLWYSSIGGDAIEILSKDTTIGSGEAASKILEAIRNGSDAGYKAMWLGDSFLGMSAISLPSNTIGDKRIMEYLAEKGLKIGRFTQGKYPIMQFALPAAALAMIFAAPKEKRMETFKKLAPGMASSFFMGITEPIEFSFLFIAPKLFYGFHAVFCGISFAAMNLLGAHVPSIFSGGFIEMILLGILPVNKGTNFWWYLVVGGGLAPIYFSVFSIAIRKFNLSTPGRESLGTLISDEETTTSKVPQNVRKLALALGGWDNVSKYSNCASRLRYDIVDKSKVSEEALKAAGIIAVKFVGENHVQLIVGPKAESINNEMLQWKGEDLG